MGFYVHIHVCFACDRNDAVATLAKEHAAKLPSDADGEREAHWFLEDLAGRTGNNRGPKGGLSLWGIVGNYTMPEVFVETLKPFWRDLLAGVDGGPCDFEHVLVFYEREQSEAEESVGHNVARVSA